MNRSRRPLHPRLAGVGLLCALLAYPLAAQDLQPQLSTVFGGSGGDAFTKDCGAGYVLAGISGRAGLMIDAVGILCRQVLPDGSLGAPSAKGSLAGGTGGAVKDIICPNSAPVMVGLFPRYGTYVDRLSVSCAKWHADTRTFSDVMYPSRVLGNDASLGQPAQIKCGSSRQPGAGMPWSRGDRWWMRSA